MIQKYVNRETIAYLVCGVLATVLAFGLYWLCTATGLSTAAANTVSTLLVMVFAFFTNKIFVFRSRVWAVKTLLREAAAFSLGRIAAYVGETGLLVLLVDRLGLPSLWCKVFTSVLVVAANYGISKWIIFRKPTAQCSNPSAQCPSHTD